MKKLAISAMLALTLTTGASAATSQAQVNDTLRSTPAIYNGLFTAGLVKHVVDSCPDLQGPNRFQRTSYFLGLFNQARGLGFSRAQIQAFVDDRDEQRRLRQVVYSHLERQGVDPRDKSAVCTWARQQMAARTGVGPSLRER